MTNQELPTIPSRCRGLDREQLERLRSDDPVLFRSALKLWLNTHTAGYGDPPDSLDDDPDWRSNG